jgi:dethiobiotin synthetase
VTGARPAVVVLVAGTGTDVGKTWVSARLLETWRRSRLSVAARKPAQSFAPDTDAGRTDAEVLATASGEDPTTVCLPARSYPVALAPPMAAAALGLPPPTIADLVAELAWPTPPVDIGLVETAGGVMSPQAADGDVIDMAVALAPDHVLLVADAGLGTLNAVRLTVAALAHTARPGPPLPAPHVILNRYDPGSDVHRRNLAWLRDVDALSVSELSSAGVAPLAARLTVPAGSVTGGAGPN